MTEILTLAVRGMTCDGCVASVERVLRRQPGVSTAKASLQANTVTVEYDAAQSNVAAIATAIRRAGYETD